MNGRSWLCGCSGVTQSIETHGETFVDFDTFVGFGGFKFLETVEGNRTILLGLLSLNDFPAKFSVIFAGKQELIHQKLNLQHPKTL
jgi:hypothetical protein